MTSVKRILCWQLPLSTMSCRRSGKTETAPPALPRLRPAAASLVPAPKTLLENRESLQCGAFWQMLVGLLLMGFNCKQSFCSCLHSASVSMYTHRGLLFWFLSSGERQRTWRSWWRATGMAGAGEERLREWLFSPWRMTWTGLKPTLHGRWGLQGPWKGRRPQQWEGKPAAHKDRALPCESNAALGQDPGRWRDLCPSRSSKLNGKATL